jgi:hypothetical protein
MTNVIDLDNWEPCASHLPYGNHWQKTITGEDLLQWHFPTPRMQQPVKVLMDPPNKAPIIDITNIPSLETVPPESTIISAIKLLSSASPQGSRTRSGLAISIPWGVRLGEEFITADAIRFFAKIYNVKKFTYMLKSTISWLESVGRQEDPGFANSFLKMLKSEAIMDHSFSVINEVEIPISSIFTFSSESWLDDDALRGITALFEQEYSNGSRNIFIMPLMFNSWHSTDEYNGKAN